jgi:hypothetical protein
MEAMQAATNFFHACDGLQGWAGCQQYVAEGASFVAQSEPLAEINTVEGYCDWMAGLGAGPLNGCSFDTHAAAFDEANNTAVFFATFTGSHVGDGGPVPPTNKETNTHYVYVLKLDDSNKISHMTKIWNAPWALNELGWS